jgi:single-stranded-DNA-specific exonuclease
VNDPESAKVYLRPGKEGLHEPADMLGLTRAVERLSLALRRGEMILVHGDYDVDGICSTTILVRTLRALGGRAEPFIPHRVRDGYDLSMAGGEAAQRAGASVLLTCDCGSSAHEAVASACAAGIDVIITDHHLPGGPMPDCLAILNPRQPGCEYPDKGLVAAGIAFKLALALVSEEGGSEEFVLRMLDLVALATVADVAPLRGENRVLVRHGLRMMARSSHVGLRALLRSAGLDDGPLTAGRVAYTLAPRLNAVGRLGHALRGVELLMQQEEAGANEIARELEELNRERQRVDGETLAQAMSQIESLDLDATAGVVLWGEGWHPGVIGIVASRVVEAVCRPTILVALDGDVGKGSGRSIPAFDLHAALGQCRDLLMRFGGHRAAAGITIGRAQLEEFSSRFVAVAAARLTPHDMEPALKLDMELPLSGATLELESYLKHFEPFGVGNAAPVFYARGARLENAPRTVGRDRAHLKLRLEQDGASLDAIGFGLGWMCPELEAGAVVDVAFRLERDEWNGEPRLQARLADVRT